MAAREKYSTKRMGRLRVNAAVWSRTIFGKRYHALGNLLKSFFSPKQAFHFGGCNGGRAARTCLQCFRSPARRMPARLPPRPPPLIVGDLSSLQRCQFPQSRKIFSSVASGFPRRHLRRRHRRADVGTEILRHAEERKAPASVVRYRDRSWTLVCALFCVLHRGSLA